MKIKHVFLILALLQSWPDYAQDSSNRLLNRRSNEYYFIENKGQWEKNVLFLFKSGTTEIWITTEGITFDYFSLADQHLLQSDTVRNIILNDDHDRIHSFRNGHVVKMNLTGRQNSCSFSGEKMLGGYHNYFIGRDSTKWARHVRLYKEVVIKDIYNGVDIRFYFDNNHFRYDFIVNPQAGAGDIGFTFEGQYDSYINQDGELVFTTRFGEVMHSELFAYQNIGNAKQKVPCEFKKANDAFTFSLGDYDHQYPVIIDPVVILYSTYIGGADDENQVHLACDNAGNAYVAGSTGSIDYPTTIGAYCDSLNHQENDVFLSKLDSTGSNLVYSTYIGGSWTDNCFDIAVDEAGNAYVCGQSGSTDFPVTAGAYDISMTCLTDGFITKVGAMGDSLIYSTYLGSVSGTDPGFYAIEVNTKGEAIVAAAGYTSYPVTPGTFGQTNNGESDVAVSKLSSDGHSLIFSTLFGGSAADVPYRMEIDQDGSIYVSGLTASADFPVTSNALDTASNGGYDVFITKMDSLASVMEYSTFFGGSNNDYMRGLRVDNNKNILISGQTNSPDFPVTNGAYDVIGNNLNEAFVAKIAHPGDSLLFSTYVGDCYSNMNGDLEIDLYGNIYLFGGCMISPAEQYVKLEILNSSGDSLLLSYTLSDGEYNLYFYTIKRDNDGYFYMTGATEYPDFNVTSGAFDTTYNSYMDVFVIKLSVDTLLNIFPLDTDDQEVLLYPNPTADKFTIVADGFRKVEILNNLGELVWVSNTMENDISHFPDGIYFLRVITDHNIKTGKLIKK